MLHVSNTLRHQVLGVGGASGGHGNSSDVTVTSEELPLDPQRMTMVTEIIMKIHRNFFLVRLLQNFHILFRKCSRKELVYT